MAVCAGAGSYYTTLLQRDLELSAGLRYVHKEEAHLQLKRSFNGIVKRILEICPT